MLDPRSFVVALLRRVMTRHSTTQITRPGPAPLADAPGDERRPALAAAPREVAPHDGEPAAR